MADTDTAPEVKPIEALTMYEAAKPTHVSGLSTELRQGIEFGKKYREIRAKGMDVKGVMEQMRQKSENPIPEAEIQEMESQFGAGMTKFEGGEIKIDETQLPKDLKSREPEIKNSFEAGKKALESINSYLRYAEVLQEANATGQKPVDILKQKDPAADSWTWKDMRKAALDSLAATGLFQKLDPKFDTYGEATKHDFIEQYMAGDPDLQAGVGKAMKAIETRLNALPNVEKGQDYEQMVAQQKQALEQMKAKVNAYANILHGYRIPIDADSLQADIEHGRAPEQILSDLKLSIVGADPNLQLQLDIEKAKTARDEAVERHRKEPKGKSGSSAAYIATLEAESNAARAEVTRLEAQFKTDVPSVTERARIEQAYLKIQQLTDTERDGALLKQAREDLNRAHTLEESLAGREGKAKKDEEKQLMQRLREESVIIDDLGRVLNNAMVDVIIDRSNNVVEAKTKEKQEEEENANKAKDEAEKEMKKKVKEGMEKNWISYEKGKRTKTVHKEQIGEDMRTITYEGEDGIKRLMLRDMGRGDWKTVDLESLDDDSKRYLEAAQKEYGDKYRDTLITDFFLARSYGDNYGFGKLYLKDFEYELLSEKFGDVLKSRLDASTHAKEILQHLEDEGIKPSKNLQWLLYALLGAGAIGAGAAFSPAVTAYAAKHGAAGLLNHLGAGVGR